MRLSLSVGQGIVRALYCFSKSSTMAGLATAFRYAAKSILGRDSACLLALVTNKSLFCLKTLAVSFWCLGTISMKAAQSTTDLLTRLAAIPMVNLGAFQHHTQRRTRQPH